MTEDERPHADVALKPASAPRHAQPFDDPIAPVSPVIAADRADCCSAGPVMRVILPATPGRAQSAQTAQLLLCAHHCRESRMALARAGAAVYDAGGQLLSSGEALARDARQLWLGS